MKAPFIGIFLTSLGLVLALPTQAATRRAATLALRGLEPPPFAKLLYRAKLQWVPGAVAETGREYRFELGVVKAPVEAPGKTRIHAVIRDGGEVVGLCLRDLSKMHSVQRDEIAMRCNGRLFGTQTVAARFRFDSRLPRPELDLEDGRRWVAR